MQKNKLNMKKEKRNGIWKYKNQVNSIFVLIFYVLIQLISKDYEFIKRIIF